MIGRNIKLVQQKQNTLKAIVSYFFVSEPWLKVKKVNIPKAVHYVNKEMLPGGMDMSK